MINYFKLSEFTVGCSPAEVSTFLSDRTLVQNVLDMLPFLNELREKLDCPLIINSCYRSPSHNKKVKGVKNSQHLDASAVDVHFNSLAMCAAIVDFALRDSRVRQVICYDTFVHIGFYSKAHPKPAKSRIVSKNSKIKVNTVSAL